MNILIISDTHQFHNQLTIPQDIDMIIHCGDCSNSKNPAINNNEVRNFIDWYAELDVKHKVYISGNHCISIERGLVKREDFESRNIDFLLHEGREIAGLKLFGSPYTPTFGEWAFMKNRAKIHEYWQDIPENLDILITHGPPKTILDLSFDRQNNLEFCGDSALLKAVIKKSPKYHCFGHIHDNQYIMNYGMRTIEECNTTFINAAMVYDGGFDKGLIHKGHIITI